MMTTHEAVNEVYRELGAVVVKFPSFNSPHEGFAVIKEELDELWEVVRQKARTLDGSGGQDKQQLRQEAKQVAAMAIRFMMDLT
jgi:NTP pyrophosphatase (non-canonical NTP hydrolase)